MFIARTEALSEASRIRELEDRDAAIRVDRLRDDWGHGNVGSVDQALRATLEQQHDGWKLALERAEKAEADAAAMRESLEVAVKAISIIRGNSRYAWEIEVLDKATKALSSTAGRDLLARMERMRELLARWAAIDAGAWHVERHAREKSELLSDTNAALADQPGEKG